MTTVEQRQRRAQLVEDARLISETATREHREMNAGESSRFDQLLAQSDTMLRDIERQERLETIERGLAATQPPPNPDIPAPGGDPTQRSTYDGGNGEIWVDKYGQRVAVLSPKQSVRDYVRSSRRVESSGLSFGEFCRALICGARTEQEKRTLQETVGSGSALVPIDLMAGVIDLLRAKSRVVQAGGRTVVLRTLETSIARVTADPVVAWRSELGALAVGEVSFDAVPFVAKSLSCIVKISRELLQDSTNGGAAIENSLAAAMAAEIDRACLIGSGTPPEPRGISKTSGVGSVSMGDNGGEFADYNPFVDAYLKLLDANAGAPTAAIMPPRTLAKLAQLQDTLHQPLQKPDLVRNLPFLETSKLPVNETQGGSSAASRVIIGDFTRLMLGIREELSIGVLKELYAENGIVGLVAHARMDCALVHPASFAQIIGVL